MKAETLPLQQPGDPMAALIPINLIVIGERARKDLGDLRSLADSIRSVGLLHPIVVKPDMTLVCGHRRIEAVRLLGWQTIPARVFNMEDMLSAERDENTERKAFTPTEAVAIKRLILAENRPISRAAWTANLPRCRHQNFESKVRSLSATELISKVTGYAASTLSEAERVVAAAEADPQAYGDLPQRMDETRRVHTAFREMQHRSDPQAKVERPVRHPVFRKMHYPRPNREVERAVFALDGICTVLEAVDASQLDPARVPQWIDDLQTLAARIRRAAKGLNAHG